MQPWSGAVSDVINDVRVVWVLLPADNNNYAVSGLREIAAIGGRVGNNLAGTNKRSTRIGGDLDLEIGRFGWHASGDDELFG